MNTPAQSSQGTIRILVFGATGTGKTSLCNALTGKSRPTDSGALGITSKSHLYAPFTHEGLKVHVVDTVGLHESVHGTVPADQAVIDLVELLDKSRDGFSLLVHVARASRITKEHDDDYKFFVEGMTQGSIPVILAVTGCENEDPMTSWVERNAAAYDRFKYSGIVATCFATGGPLESVYEPLRSQSKTALLAAVQAHALPAPALIYGPGTTRTFGDLLTKMWNEFVSLAGLSKEYRRKTNESVYQLLKRLGVPETIADKARKHIPDLMEEVGGRVPIPWAGKILRKLSEFALDQLSKRKAP